MTAESILTPYIRAAEAAAVLDKSDYVEDGILHCGRCLTPKQYILPVNGRLVPCLCRCQAAARDAQEEYERERQRAIRISQLRADGIQDRHVREYTFAAAEPCPIIDKAKRYVAAWDRMLKQGIGLLLWGDTSTGKTFAAACIANALIDRGVPVLVTSFPSILAELQGCRDDRAAFIDSLTAYDLLVIDDLGVERQSEYAIEQVFAVIDARDKCGKPIIITTNIPLTQIKSPDGTPCKRIYERILGMTVPIYVGGFNRRATKGLSKAQTLRELFTEDANEQI